MVQIYLKIPQLDTYCYSYTISNKWSIDELQLIQLSLEKFKLTSLQRNVTINDELVLTKRLNKWIISKD